MPLLTERPTARYAKMLILGGSGTGKTTSLISLVRDGYKVRFLDFDDLLDSLTLRIKEQCPDKLGNVGFVTLRDKRKASETGPVLDGPPRAFISAAKLLDKWEDGTTPSAWGDDHVLVIDSLTRFSDAAKNWADAFVPFGKGGRDERMVFFEAQKKVEHFISMLTSPQFATNVIVLAHIQWNELQEGMTKGYPDSVGKALGPRIPTYFHTVALAEVSGKAYSIRSVSTAQIDLKNPAAFKLAPTLPSDSALSTIFKELKA